MSDDLISRSALIEHIEDIYCEDCSKCHGTCRLDELKDIIQEQPTAYDKEKVVEQLENEIELVVTQYPMHGKYIKKCRAIEIVKEGGINE